LADIHVVRSLSGEALCSLRLALDESVWVLKRHIGRRAALAEDEQRLVLVSSAASGRVLWDFEAVGDILSAEGDGRAGAGALEVALTQVAPDRERAALLKQLESGKIEIWELPAQLQADPECALAAVRRSQLVVKFLSQSVRSDRSFVLAAVREKAKVLQYCPEHLKNDRRVVLAAVAGNGAMLQHASPELCGDREVVLQALRRNSEGAEVLQHCPEHIKNDRQVVLAAVASNGAMLQHASLALRNDKEVVLQALSRSSCAIKYAGEQIKSETGFLACLEQRGYLEDPSFDHLLWIKPEAASACLKKEAAFAVDARSLAEFKLSHIKGAHSLPERTPLTASPLMRLLTDNAGHIIVVYSDYGFDVSRCGSVAGALRAHPGLPAHRVRRLAGGLNGWKEERFPVDGTTSKMFRGRVYDESMRGQLERFRNGGGFAIVPSSH